MSRQALSALIGILAIAAAPSGCRPRGERAGAAGGRALTFWHIQSAGRDRALIDEDVARFRAAHPAIPVEVVPFQNDPYKTKLKLAMGAGDPPCVFSSWGAGSLRPYVDAGMVADLTSLSGANHYLDRFTAAAAAGAEMDGKVWGIPGENTSVALVFYSKKIFARLGIAPPKTDGELFAVVRRLRDAGVAPFALANKTKWPGLMYYMYLVERVGGPEPFRAAARGAPGPGFRHPAFVRAAQLLQDLVRAGAFNPGFNGLDYDTGQSRSLLYGGRAAMELMGTWTITHFKDENPAFRRDELDFFPFPAIAGGAGDPRDLVGAAGDQYYSVSSTCPYREEAFRLIQGLIDGPAVAARIAEGRIPPVRGVRVDDPLLQKVARTVEEAPSVQLWYDQYLAPELAETVKDVTQALFGLTVSPDAAATQLEEAARAVRARQVAAVKEREQTR